MFMTSLALGGVLRVCTRRQSALRGEIRASDPARGPTVYNARTSESPSAPPADKDSDASYSDTRRIVAILGRAARLALPRPAACGGATAAGRLRRDGPDATSGTHGLSGAWFHR